VTFRGISDDSFAMLLDIVERLAADVVAIKTALAALERQPPRPPDPPEAREFLARRKRRR
jgi:hypothetical protein